MKKRKKVSSKSSQRRRTKKWSFGTQISLLVFAILAISLPLFLLGSQQQTNTKQFAFSIACPTQGTPNEPCGGAGDGSTGRCGSSDTGSCHGVCGVYACEQANNGGAAKTCTPQGTVGEPCGSNGTGGSSGTCQDCGGNNDGACHGVCGTLCCNSTNGAPPAGSASSCSYSEKHADGTTHCYAGTCRPGTSCQKGDFNNGCQFNPAVGVKELSCQGGAPINPPAGAAGASCSYSEKHTDGTTHCYNGTCRAGTSCQKGDFNNGCQFNPAIPLQEVSCQGGAAIGAPITNPAPATPTITKACPGVGTVSVPRTYPECTFAGSFCAGQVGLTGRSVTVTQNTDCSYSCHDNGTGCGTAPNIPIAKSPAPVVQKPAPGLQQPAPGVGAQCTTLEDKFECTFAGSGCQQKYGSTNLPNLEYVHVVSTTCGLTCEDEGFKCGGNLPDGSISCQSARGTGICRANGLCGPSADQEIETSNNCSQLPGSVCCVAIAVEKSIALSAHLTGIGNGATGNGEKENSNPQIKTVNATVSLVNVGAVNDNGDTRAVPGQTLQTSTGRLTYDATSGNYVNQNFPLTNVTPGEYKLLIHVDHYLNQQVVSSDTSTVFTFPVQSLSSKVLSLIPGDIAPSPKGDNYIDIQDYNTMIGCLSNGGANCPNEASSDLNNDGKVDNADLQLLLDHFGSVGDSPTTPKFVCEADPSCTQVKKSLQLCPMQCKLEQVPL